MSKTLINKFDQYEVQAALNQTAEDYLNTAFKRSNRAFYIKCILGVLLTINIYLSHWYPVPWPKSYYLIVFCVIFYYAASYYFQSLDIVSKSKGGFIGEYNQGKDIVRKYTLEFKKCSPEMTLKQYDSKCKELKSGSFEYNQYIDQDGNVLKSKFNDYVKKFVAVKKE